MTKGCKRYLGTVDDDQGLPFNSCGEDCYAELPCQHVCDNVCHPGPCEECQLCERAVPRLVLPRRRIAPQDSLELIRGWVPRVQHFNEDIERADHPFPASGPATSNAGPRTLRAGTWAPLVICLAVTIFMAGSIFGLTKVIVEPYNHRSIAENNDAMRAAWTLLVLGGLVNLGLNLKSASRVREFAFYCQQEISGTSFAASWTSWMRICEEVEFCWDLTKFVALHVYFYSLVVWVIGSLAW